MENRNPNDIEKGVIDLIKFRNSKKSKYAEEASIIDDITKMKQIIEGIEAKYTLNNSEDKGIDKNKQDIITNKTNHACMDTDPLWGEMEILKMKLNYPLPNVLIIYIICSTAAFATFTTIFILTFITGKQIIDLVTCLICIFGSLGLLITSVTSIKDWRDYLKNV